MRMLPALLLAPLFTSAALAQPADWKKAWDETLAAARKEGKVVVAGPPSAELRNTMPSAFKSRFGLTVEYIAGRSSETAIKLRAEKQAGAMSADVIIGGLQTMATIFYREKMLEPLRPAMMLPEVTDGTKWKKGKLWFADPDDQYVLRLANTVSISFYINTDYVKPGELRTMQDLLDPKWSGKISLQDPTVPGSGSNQAAPIYVTFGEDYVRKLFIDQKPAISRDTRQLTDWLARGTYPISNGAEDGLVDRMIAEGQPIAPLELSDLPEMVAGGFGQVAMLNGAPHPNAAKIFVNWLASREGAEIFGRAMSVASTRNDINESFLPPEVVPHADRTYFDTYDWEFTVTTKEAIRLRIKELMAR